MFGSLLRLVVWVVWVVLVRRSSVVVVVFYFLALARHLRGGGGRGGGRESLIAWVALATTCLRFLEHMGMGVGYSGILAFCCCYYFCLGNC